MNTDFNSIYFLQNPIDQQLDWDDTALTITINPMQNDNLTDESSDSDNSDSDDDEGNNLIGGRSLESN